MTRIRAIGDGVRAAIPIVMAYVPVAVTFGIAGTAAGLTPLQVLLISAFIYAGASQFLLLASIQSGLPVVWIVALCAMLNARHFLYGPLLSAMLPPRLRTRLLLASGLTDEVFSTALRRLPEVPQARGAWMAGIGATAWLSWLCGTALGAFGGDVITNDFPALARVLSFTLPALFLTLTIQSANAVNRGAALAAAVLGALLALNGQSSLAILGGAAGGCAYYWLRTRGAGQARKTPEPETRQDRDIRDIRDSREIRMQAIATAAAPAPSAPQNTSQAPQSSQSSQSSQAPRTQEPYRMERQKHEQGDAP